MLNRLRQLLRRGHGEEGAAAVEFALILPLLILLVLGGMDLGHAYYLNTLSPLPVGKAPVMDRSIT